MKVKFILETNSFLTKGNVYEVVSIDDINHRFLIRDDNKERVWCSKDKFKILEDTHYK